MVCHKSPERDSAYGFSAPFADYSKSKDRGQLCYIGGIRFGDLSSGSIFHTIYCSFHEPKIPFEYIGAAKILASDEAINEGNVLLEGFDTFLQVNCNLLFVFDSNDFF